MNAPVEERDGHCSHGQAMEGCKFVIHCASPFKSQAYRRYQKLRVWSFTWLSGRSADASADASYFFVASKMQKSPRLDAKDVQKELIEPAVKGTEAKWSNLEEWNWSKIDRKLRVSDSHMPLTGVSRLATRYCFSSVLTETCWCEDKMIETTYIIV